MQFELMPDNSEQQQQAVLHQQKFRVNNLDDLRLLCRKIGMRARALSDKGDYAGHVFEDGTICKELSQHLK